MKPLIVLLSVFVAGSVISRVVVKDWNLLFAGNLAMCLMLVLTASGHILFTKGMTMMLPTMVPFKIFVIYLTGITEIILGLALLFPSVRGLAGVTLIVLFILLLPANIYAAIKHLDMEQATYAGSGPGYLWFRIPLQLFFIAWVAYFSI